MNNMSSSLNTKSDFVKVSEEDARACSDSEVKKSGEEARRSSNSSFFTSSEDEYVRVEREDLKAVNTEIVSNEIKTTSDGIGCDVVSNEEVLVKRASSVEIRKTSKEVVERLTSNILYQDLKEPEFDLQEAPKSDDKKSIPDARDLVSFSPEARDDYCVDASCEDVSRENLYAMRENGFYETADNYEDFMEDDSMKVDSEGGQYTCKGKGTDNIKGHVMHKGLLLLMGKKGLGKKGKDPFGMWHFGKGKNGFDAMKGLKGVAKGCPFGKGEGKGKDHEGKGKDHEGKGKDNEGKGKDNEGKGKDHEGKGKDNEGKKGHCFGWKGKGMKGMFGGMKGKCMMSPEALLRKVNGKIDNADDVSSWVNWPGAEVVNWADMCKDMCKGKGKGWWMKCENGNSAKEEEVDACVQEVENPSPVAPEVEKKETNNSLDTSDDHNLATQNKQNLSSAESISTEAQKLSSENCLSGEEYKEFWAKKKEWWKSRLAEMMEDKDEKTSEEKSSTTVKMSCGVKGLCCLSTDFTYRTRSGCVISGQTLGVGDKESALEMCMERGGTLTGSDDFYVIKQRVTEEKCAYSGSCPLLKKIYTAKKWNAVECVAEKYHVGNDVILLPYHGLSSQQFVLNGDNTISPKQEAHCVLGLSTTDTLVLVHFDSPRSIIFDGFRPCAEEEEGEESEVTSKTNIVNKDETKLVMNGVWAFSSIKKKPRCAWKHPPKKWDTYIEGTMSCRDGLGLELGDDKGKFLGHAVRSLKVVSKTEIALNLHFEEIDGSYFLRRAENTALEVELGKYVVGTKIVGFFNHREDHQKFVINPDFSISPLKKTDLFLGANTEGDVVLVSEKSGALCFTSLEGKKLKLFERTEESNAVGGNAESGSVVTTVTEIVAPTGEEQNIVEESKKKVEENVGTLFKKEECVDADPLVFVPEVNESIVPE